MTTIIYTDGSSRGNPGPGGWGTIIKEEGYVKELGGGYRETTNNRMELTAAIEGLRYAKGSDITVLSDSEYVIKGITVWIHGWLERGWKNSQKKDVLNKDLWEALYVQTKNKNIKWKYVAGHTGNPGNERCDEIATAFADGLSPVLYDNVDKSYKISLKV